MTATGLIVIALGVWASLRPTFVLLMLLVVALPFSATSVVNIGSKNGFPPSVFFAALYMTKVGLTWLRAKMVPRPPALSALLFGVFGATLLLSLSTSLNHPEHHFFAVDPAGGLKAEFRAHLSFEQAKQFAYFLFWFLVSLCSMHDLRVRGRGFTLLRLTVWTAVFVSLWGWMQLLLSVFHLPYPHGIFNNTLNPSGQGYLQKIDGLSISRMSSVATEPSVFAAHLLLCVAILTGFLIRNSVLVHPQLDFSFTIFFVLTVLASTAITGYMGLGFLLGLVFVVLLLTRQVGRSKIIAVGLVALIAVLFGAAAYVSSEGFRVTLENFLLGKKDSFSFAQRFGSTQFALAEFQKFPLFGLGIAAMTVYSLPFWLLANTGLLGTVSFVLFYLSLFFAPLKLLFQVGKSAQAFGLAVVLALMVTFFVGVVSGFPYVFGYFWFPIMLSFSALAVRGSS